MIYVLLILVILLLVKEIFTFLNNSMIVKYQRNTGPELMVEYGEEQLRKMSLNKENVNFSELYTTYNFDINTGFNNGRFIVEGKIIAYKKENDKLYPLFKIEAISSMIGFYLKISGLFILLILILVLLSRLHPHQQKHPNRHPTHTMIW